MILPTAVQRAVVELKRALEYVKMAVLETLVVPIIRKLIHSYATHKSAVSKI